MNETRKIGKRLLSAALAAIMAVTTVSTQAFATAEEGKTDTTAEVSSHVLSWSWPEGSNVTWDEDTQTWILACTYSESQPLTQEMLTQLLPTQVEAVVQSEAATSETATEDTVADETEAEEGTDVPASDAAVSEGSTSADSVATPDTAVSDDRTPMKKAAPEENAANDTDTAQAEPQTYTEDLTLTWDFSGLTFPLQTGEYTLTASLPQAYQREQGTPAVQLKLQVYPAVMEANDLQTRAIGNKVTNTISPMGTTINVFDYWVRTQSAADNSFNYGGYYWNGNEYELNTGDVEKGINQGHALKFSTGNGYDTVNDWDKPAKIGGKLNVWTGSNWVRSGLVEDTLVDGFPKLNQAGARDSDALDYLKYDESLAYLFNSDNMDGKESWQNVKGLLQLNEGGYYYYDCKQNFAKFNKDTNSFDVYNAPKIYWNGVDQNSAYGQFFPFDEASYPTGGSQRTDSENTHHYFGLTMTTRFVQQPNGTVDGEDNSDPVTYEFSGDDDVWVFIDDVLVGDLGGIHDTAKLKIDFSTGKIFINEQQPEDRGTLKACFAAAEKDGNIEWNGNTFAANTYHTLKFFYLERGNGESNMSLKFNLVSIPQSDLIKVDQTGDPVPGAEFELYAADENYQCSGAPIATGTTDSDGSFVFLKDGTQTILKLNDLKEQSQSSTSKFVLREKTVPTGYRSAGDMHLYFDKDINQAILLSANAWQTGAYAMPMVTATLSDTVYQYGENSTISFNSADGLYFAVVLKKEASNQTDTSDWYPVSGDPINGWTVSEKNTIDAVLAAAKANSNPYIFRVDTSGAFSTTVENLPGDIKQYYFIREQNPSLAGEAEYTVAYYHTRAKTLSEANPNNTVRVDPDRTNYKFTREFAVRLYVPNIKNVLTVQKVDDNGTPLTGAQFTLTQLDKDNQPIGATAQTVTTSDLSQDNHDDITLKGGAVFPATGVLANGTYILQETKAPTGYAASSQRTTIIVNNTGVYADAGTATDEVTVLRGAGNLVRSMVQFAKEDHIDTTLSKITATLYTSKGEFPTKNITTISEKYWEKWQSTDQEIYLDYEASGHALDYGPALPDGSIYFEVTEGWSSVKVTQTDKGNDPLKQDWSGKDLSNLFSRSTIVRVKNTPVGLTIAKAVTSDGTGTDSELTAAVDNETFTFMITKQIYSQSWNGWEWQQQWQTDTSYNDFVTLNPGNTSTNFQNGELQVTVTGVGNVTISGLQETQTGQSRYLVQEIRRGSDSVNAQGMQYTWDHVTYTGGDTQENNGISVTLDDANASKTVTATNHYKAEYRTLTVTKTVDGNLGDKSRDFSFNLKVWTKNSNGQEVAYTGALQVTTDGAPTPGTALTATDNQYTFTLKHGEKIEIRVPSQAKVTVTEPAVNGYTTSSRSYITGTSSKPDPTPNDLDQTITSMSGPYTVDFVNNCTIQVPTGLHGETRPYAAMMALAGAAALISIAGWVALRRRKRREQE